MLLNANLIERISVSSSAFPHSAPDIPNLINTQTRSGLFPGLWYELPLRINSPDCTHTVSPHVHRLMVQRYSVATRAQTDGTATSSVSSHEHRLMVQPHGQCRHTSTDWCYSHMVSVVTRAQTDSTPTWSVSPHEHRLMVQPHSNLKLLALVPELGATLLQFLPF